MSRFLYSLVRCVPDPRTGEFINLGAIAGDPTTGEWSLRQVGNESRARKLGGTNQLEAVHGFLARVGEQIDLQMNNLEMGEEVALSEDWLFNLYSDHRNIVQLSKPEPIIAINAEEALDVVFRQMIIDPISAPRGGIDKNKVLTALGNSYRNAEIAPQLIRKGVEVFVGDRVNTPMDFAIANGSVFQLCQAWSFQRLSIDDLAINVKAWGYALRGLRDGLEARVMGAHDSLMKVDKDVELAVVFAKPETQNQNEVFEEAEQVFKELGVHAYAFEQVDQVAERAKELVASRGI